MLVRINWFKVKSRIDALAPLPSPRCATPMQCNATTEQPRFPIGTRHHQYQHRHFMAQHSLCQRSNNKQEAEIFLEMESRARPRRQTWSPWPADKSPPPFSCSIAQHTGLYKACDWPSMNCTVYSQLCWTNLDTGGMCHRLCRQVKYPVLNCRVQLKVFEEKITKPLPTFPNFIACGYFVTRKV